MRTFSSLKISSSSSSSSSPPSSKVGKGGGEETDDDGEKSARNNTGGDDDVVAFLDAGFTFTIALGDDERRRREEEEEEEDDDINEKNISERERAVQPPGIVLVVSYCFDISNAKVRERLESGFRKEEKSEDDDDDDDGEKAFVFELAELTTNVNDDEKEIRVRVESEKLQKILDATPKRVQENVACVLVEMFSERREEEESAPTGKRIRTDAMTVIAKHTRDEATGRLKRTFVNPFLD
jgi:hypothetical protein